MDLHDKIDCDAFEKILSKSDVYISNLRNGALEKLGPYGYTPEQVLKLSDLTPEVKELERSEVGEYRTVKQTPIWGSQRRGK